MDDFNKDEWSEHDHRVNKHTGFKPAPREKRQWERKIIIIMNAIMGNF